MPEPATPARILVVDDDEDVAELLAAHCRQLGHRAETALTGRDAVRRAQEAPPDVVILDLLLPDLDGRAVLEELRAHPATASCLVVLTSILDPQDYPDGDVAAVLPKPFRRSDVERVLGDLLGGTD